MKKFFAGMFTSLFLITMINCSGSLPTKQINGMQVIEHGASPRVQEKPPCDK